MVAKLPTFIDIHMFSQGHSWWQNSRLLYMVKKQFSQGHSWWQNSRLIYIYVFSQGHSWWQKAPNFYIWYIYYIYMFSQNWYTTNEKEHIAHHIKHFEVSPKNKANFERSLFEVFKNIGKPYEVHSKFLRNFEWSFVLTLTIFQNVKLKT